MHDFIKGVDISSLQELENLGAKYYDNGVEGDLFCILKDYQVNSVRLRLWMDPYSEDGRPYGAGTNDLNTTILLAKRSLEQGFGFLLNIHYSDFWTDPGKQIMPKAWKGYDNEQLITAIYDYTREVLLQLKAAKTFPTMIQIGNELTNGFLWPNAKMPNYEVITDFINSAIHAVKSVDQKLPIMLHLDNGGNNKLYRDWFDHYFERGEDFDCIGLSYYPFWHGGIQDLEYNMKDIAKRYQKDLIIAEVSMGFTLEDYAQYEQLAPEERKGMATKQALADKVPYPMTPEGQSDFMQTVMELLTKVPEGRGKGFYYWEPAWLPVKGSGWATAEGLEYIQDKGPCGNEWANQALFDYKGNSLKCLKTIRDFK